MDSADTKVVVRRISTSKITVRKKDIVLFCPFSAVTDEYANDLFQPLIKHFEKEYNCWIVRCQIDFKSSLSEYTTSCLNQLSGIFYSNEDLIFIGWCSGGILAKSCSDAQDQRIGIISKLFLIDTYECNYISDFKESLLIFKDKEVSLKIVISLAEQMLGSGAELFIKELIEKQEQLVDSSLGYLIYNALNDSKWSLQIMEKVVDRSVDLSISMEQESLRLSSQMINKQFPTDTVIFTSSDNIHVGIDPFLGWNTATNNGLKSQTYTVSSDVIMKEENSYELVSMMLEEV